MNDVHVILYLKIAIYLQYGYILVLRNFVNIMIVHSTGRQPPPLSSVLYRIIYKRRSVVAAQELLREKSGA